MTGCVIEPQMTIRWAELSDSPTMWLGNNSVRTATVRPTLMTYSHYIFILQCFPGWDNVSQAETMFPGWDNVSQAGTMFFRLRTFPDKGLFLRFRQCFQGWDNVSQAGNFSRQRTICQTETMFPRLKQCFPGRNNVSQAETMFPRLKQCFLVWEQCFPDRELFPRLKQCFLGWEQCFPDRELFPRLRTMFPRQKPMFSRDVPPVWSFVGCPIDESWSSLHIQHKGSLWLIKNGFHCIHILKRVLYLTMTQQT